MEIIDETYNGKKFPIIERDYNAYFFPDNYDPENPDAYQLQQEQAALEHRKVEVFEPEDIKQE